MIMRRMCQPAAPIRARRERKGVKRMDKKVCDRCNATIKYPRMPNRFKRYSFYIKICLTREINEVYRLDEIDLCDKCRIEFEKWLGNTEKEIE